MVDKKQDTELPANDEAIAAGDAEQANTSGYQNYLLPEANNGQGRAVKARSLTEAIAKAEKLDNASEGSK